MKTLAFQAFLTFICLSALLAQPSSEKILLTIGKQQVTAGEFERIYLKNSNINTAEKQSINDYFDLFIKFKLKVSAALDAGLDTLSSFKNELKGYRDQLAKTYLTDNTLADKILHEAYDRMLTDVNISHIMIMLPSNVSVADTAAAYKKLIDIRKKYLAGEPFDTLAVKYSEDPSAKLNKGYLGWFVEFMYPYQFESCAYNTKVGEISMPVRTLYGYHLIKVNSRRPSPGEVKVAHIMLTVPKSASDSVKNAAKEKIYKIYHQVKNGGDFSKLARENSNDEYSFDIGGELAWFGSGRMVPEFEAASFALKTPGEISQPVQSVIGWHIIKLIDKRPIAPFDQVKNDLKTKLANDEQRNNMIQQAFIAKLKKTYPNKLYPENLANFYNLDSTVFIGNVNINTAILSKPLLTINKQDFTCSGFKKNLESNHAQNTNLTVKEYINNSFKKFCDKSLINYEDENLEKNYPEFRNLITEYHDGILLFDIMDQKVWSKASSDTLGLRAYYKDVWVTGKQEPKKFEEAKGLITADYQNYLEEKWIAELKNKYKIEINQDLFDKIAAKYKTPQ